MWLGLLYYVWKKNWGDLIKISSRCSSLPDDTKYYHVSYIWTLHSIDSNLTELLVLIYSQILLNDVFIICVMLSMCFWKWKLHVIVWLSLMLKDANEFMTIFCVLWSTYKTSFHNHKNIWKQKGCQKMKLVRWM